MEDNVCPECGGEKRQLMACLDCGFKLTNVSGRNMDEKNRYTKNQPISNEGSSQNKERSAGVIDQINKIVVNGEVPMRVAQKIIKNSAYWYDHPCGHPVNAPRNFERVQHGKYGWEIVLGANTFHVGCAISECVTIILRELQNSTIKSINCKKLRDTMEKSISLCVTNYAGEFYDHYRVDEKGFMKFGSHAINVKDIINIILNYIHIDVLCR